MTNTPVENDIFGKDVGAMMCDLAKNIDTIIKQKDPEISVVQITTGLMSILSATMEILIEINEECLNKIGLHNTPIQIEQHIVDCVVFNTALNKISKHMFGVSIGITSEYNKKNGTKQ